MNKLAPECVRYFSICKLRCNIKFQFLCIWIIIYYICCIVGFDKFIKKENIQQIVQVKSISLFISLF